MDDFMPMNLDGARNLKLWSPRSLPSLPLSIKQALSNSGSQRSTINGLAACLSCALKRIRTRRSYAVSWWIPLHGDSALVGGSWTNVLRSQKRLAIDE